MTATDSDRPGTGPASPVRDLGAAVLNASGAARVLGWVMNSRRLRGPLVRGVNYHETPETTRRSFADHLEYYQQSFDIIGADALLAFLEGTQTLERPGLLVSFDDGFKSNYTVAAEVLDRFGVKGWFFVPAAFPACAGDPDAARAFVTNQLYAGALPGHWRDEDVMPMSWDDLRDLVRRGHVVGCHTMSHVPLGPGVDCGQLQEEIIEARRVMEQELGAPVVAFCWPFGMLSSYSVEAFALVQAHYRLAFTTFGAPLSPGDSPYAVDRSHVEAWMPLARAQCAVQGVTEVYLSRRRRQFETLVGLA